MAQSWDGKPAKSVRRREMDGLGPITDYDSKTVMLAAERHDIVEIDETVKRFDEDTSIPDEISVIRRTETYYGPQLFVHATVDGEDSNFLINAPGPDSHLWLWAGEMSQNDKRKSWFAAAEVKATLAAEQPPYEICEQCREEIRTIEHERASLIGDCSRV